MGPEGFKENKGFSLRPTLVTSVIFIILLASGLVGGFAYYQSKSIINHLWHHLANLISQSITEKTQNFLSPAVPFLKFSSELESSEVITNVTRENPVTLMEYSYAGMDTHPDFASISFSYPDGTMIGAYKDPKNNRILVTQRRITNEDPQSKTLVETYAKGKDKEFELIETTYNNYDPRERPFWKTGLEKPQGGWTPPYHFWTGNEPSIAYVQPEYNKSSLQGMWVVEFHLRSISDYLSKLTQTFAGPIALITDNDIMIASSEGDPPISGHIQQEVSPEELLKGKYFFAQPKVQLLLNAWNYAKSPEVAPNLFSYNSYLGDITRFSMDSTVSWNILTMISERQLFAPIIAQAWHALYVALGLCLLCILMGALFFGHISKRLKEIAYELDLIKNFKFTPRLFSARPSLVREINMMNNAVDTMKTGIQSFAKYVPVQLVQELIKTGHAASLGGKKKELTILFTDLADFTSLAEKMPPNDLLHILDQYLQSMSEIIILHKGTVDKYIGDSILAFWGAPKLLNNHAESACMAALVMKKNLVKLWGQWEKEKMPLLHQRIGINTGDVIVGNIGSPARMDYTVIGDHVNLASRLEGLNKLYSTDILIGDGTAKQIGPHFLVRPVDWVAVKGKSESGLVHHLICLKDEASPSQQLGVDTYIEAFKLYESRRFVEAKSKFDRANELLGGQDGPSLVLAERCLSYAKEPPPSTWKGFFIAKEK